MTRPTSIRKRLFYQLAIVAAVLSLAFVMVVRGVASRAAEGTQDDILAASATAIADSLSSEQGEVTLELPYSALSMLGTINEDRVFYRVTVEGETLTGYPDLPVSNLPTRIDTPAFSTEFYRGDEVRLSSILRRVSNTATGSRVVVTVAQTRSGLAAITQRITITATGVGLLFFLLATTLSLLAANSALRPLRRMTGAVTRRGPSDLRPVTAETPAELAPLVDALNSFMARLRSSLSRTEDLITEAAHRVRTPLATVRTQAEVTHRKLNKPEHKQAIRDMIRAIDESSRSAGQILDHAMVTFRADSLALDPLDLVALTTETCDRLAPTADLKDIAFVRRLPAGPVTFKGDSIMLQAALHNILDNAIKYSPEDSDITIRIDVSSDIKLSIEDQGWGFGDADLTSLTNRYSRGSNVGDVVGSGLGLTIADEVARAHGGTLELSHSMEGQGACVSLILPYV